MAKLILVDNYGRETVADVLVEAGISEAEAQAKADKYNADHSMDYWWFAKAVPDDYRLWKGISELV